MLNLSVTILSKNSAAKIGKALASVGFAKEVIVLDSGSTDSTETIAKSYPNVKFYKDTFCGFGPMKNKAAALATQDWIFNLDSDEVLSPELQEELKALSFHEKKIYKMPRRNHYRGKWIKGCDWYPDSVIRLYHRKITSYSDAIIHEHVLLAEGQKLEVLNGSILHFPYENVSQLISKLDHYSTLYAEQKKGKRISTLELCFRSLFSFFRNYILKRGFMLGREGVLISFCSAAGVFYKNMKLIEANESAK